MKLKKAFVATLAAVALVGGATGAHAQEADETQTVEQYEDISCNLFDLLELGGPFSPESENIDCSDEYDESMEVEEQHHSDDEGGNTHVEKKRVVKRSH